MRGSGDRVPEWLGDIVANADQIALYIDGIDEAGFAATPMRRDAVERCLERIAEACVRIGPERLAEIVPDLPVQQVRGLGNMLRHEYERIEAEVIWQTATARVPELRNACAAWLSRTSDGKDR